MDPRELVALAKRSDCGVFLIDRSWTPPDDPNLWGLPQVSIRTIDGHKCETEGKLLVHFGEVLGFPGYYGRNWDAFHECIIDHEFTPRVPTVLIVDRFERLLQRERKSRHEIFARIMNSVVGGVANSGYDHMPEDYQHHFWVFLRCPDRRKWPGYFADASAVQDLRPAEVPK